MRKLLIAAAALGLLPLAACESTPAPAASGSAGFDRRDFSWSSARGTGRIDGQLVYRRGNITYSCQQAGVVLTPDTPWVRERMQRLYRSTDRAVAAAGDVRERMPAQSPNYDSFVRKGGCDSQGRFAFANLPDGTWYLITSGVPSQGDAVLAFMRRVVIRGGAPVRVEL